MMPELAMAAFKLHVESEHPREACGLLVDTSEGLIYLQCRNVAENPLETFVVSPNDYVNATHFGKVAAVCHSHPNGSTAPSEADRAACGASGLPWFIARNPGWDVRRIEPEAYIAPLLGREFVHGVHDCYSLVRDYYKLELDIELPDFERADNWWDNGQDLYRTLFAEAGFRQVDELREHDGILMQIRSPVPNHAAVFLGDDKILHHLNRGLSRRDVFGGYWARHKTAYLRHKDLA